MSYVCTKALRISGVDYAPGDAIPDGAIRPERVRALKTSGFIGELTEEVAPPADKKPEEKVVIEQVTIPVKAEDGREMEVSLVLSGLGNSSGKNGRYDFAYRIGRLFWNRVG